MLDFLRSTLNNDRCPSIEVRKVTEDSRHNRRPVRRDGSSQVAQCLLVEFVGYLRADPQDHQLVQGQTPVQVLAVKRPLRPADLQPFPPR